MQRGLPKYQEVIGSDGAGPTVRERKIKKMQGIR
jgi:hypothetical protein